MQPPESSSCAVLLIDGEGRIITCTPPAAELLGQSVQSLVGSELVSHVRRDSTVPDRDGCRLRWEVLVESAGAGGMRLLAAAGKALLDLRLDAGAPAAAWICTLNRAAAGSAMDDVGSSWPLADACERLCQRGAFGFFDLRCDAGVLRTSPGWKRMLGYAEREWTDDPEAWRGLAHPEDSGAVPDRVARRQLPGVHGFNVEYRLRHRDGRYLWTSCIGLREIDERGTVVRILGLQIDISERKEVEELGLLEEERLRRLEEAGLAAFDFDYGQDRHWLSAGLLRLLGCLEAERQIRPDVLSAALAANPSGGLAEILSSADGRTGGVGCAIELRNREGAPLSARMWFQRDAGEDGELLRVTGFLAAGERLGGLGAGGLVVSALGLVAEGVLVTGSSGRVVFANAKAAVLLGRPVEALVGLSLEQAFPIVDRAGGQPSAGALDLALDQVAEPAGCPLYDRHALPGLHSASPVVPIIWSVRECRDDDGARTGYALIFRDPEELSLTPDELVKVNRFESLGLLAGGIAHDFNNLLTVILGGVSTARENRDFNQLGEAEEACLAAKKLTRQLLAFAKGGGKQATRQVTTPVDLLQNAVRIAAAGSPVVVRVQAEEGLHPVEVDKGQIMQVVQNLVINAIQAAPDPMAGRIEVRATNVELLDGEVDPLPAGSYVRVDVEDNGPGIPSELIPRIFNPFFTTKKNGTGLGLATASSIVRRHGGRIGVRSEPGAGTVFGFFLPAAEAPVEATARRAPSIRFGTGRILLMDDDPKICELTGGMLASLDYTHDVARHGEEAVQLYRRYLNIGRPYDVVLLDITVIGGMGGEACLRRLRELDPEVRAIVSSGYDEDGLIKQYLDQGFVACLTKPYRVSDLARVLKAVLGR